jgi:hypothetical protein
MQLDMGTNIAHSVTRPMPKFIRRSLVALSIDDPQLREKAFASWARAISSECQTRHRLAAGLASAYARRDPCRARGHGRGGGQSQP